MPRRNHRKVLLASLTAVLLAAGSFLSWPAEAQPASDDPQTVDLVAAPGGVGQMGRKVAKAVKEKYGIDASQVQVFVLDAAHYLEAYTELVGGDGRPLGFEYKGVVFVRDNVMRLSLEILAHEVLHASSQRFSSEAQAHGFQHFIEGTTDYLTHAIYPRKKLGDTGMPTSAYDQYEQITRRVAELVGEETLRRCYFEDGFDVLVARVDAVLGKGSMMRAALRLQEDDFPAARAALSTARASKVKRK